MCDNNDVQNCNVIRDGRRFSVGRFRAGAHTNFPGSYVPGMHRFFVDPAQ